jgi:hypothetical protein
MNWVPYNEFVHPHSIWLTRSYYRPVSTERQALLGVEAPEAPSREYLVLILLHPEEGRWIRSKTKHGDLQKNRESEAVDNVIFLSESAFRPLDFTDNLGHDDDGRMMFYERRIYPQT